ncbi:GNAT family N-acetyltransferase [Kribbella deserti]|uniref:GNAT family N-acetyltransferase n=1 Tax=Kribbella deserti TaxID=1926257 RepID=A0ABV6QKK8_9ACTN
MAIECSTPGVDDLPGLSTILAGWQRTGEPAQLHSGDVGWFWRFGPERTANALRVWRRDGQVVAMGLLDEPEYLRLAIDPELQGDAVLAEALAAGSAEAVSPGEAFVDVPEGSPVREILLALDGWELDEPWQPLVRDLTEPVEDSGLSIEVVTVETAAERTAVQRSAFDGSTFTDERWHAMAAGAPYGDARCLLGRDGAGHAVAAVTVWAAGPGRPGILEPMGVHRDFRGVGYGQAITVAAAAALRELGASEATVHTPSFNTGAVATYQSAGFTALPQMRAIRRLPTA